MLEDKPEVRGSAAVVLEHPWMSVGDSTALLIKLCGINYCFVFFKVSRGNFETNHMISVLSSHGCCFCST